MEGSGECSCAGCHFAFPGCSWPWRGNCLQMIFLWSGERRAAQGGVCDCVGAFGDCHVPCSDDDSAARVAFSCQFASPCEASCVCGGVEKAQLTISGRPRGFGHVCKQLPLAVLLRRVSDICACPCQAAISPPCPGEAQELSLAFWQSLQPKVVFLRIIPLEWWQFQVGTEKDLMKGPLCK